MQSTACSSLPPLDHLSFVVMWRLSLFRFDATEALVSICFPLVLNPGLACIYMYDENIAHDYVFDTTKLLSVLTAEMQLLPPAVLKSTQ